MIYITFFIVILIDKRGGKRDDKRDDTKNEYRYEYTNGKRGKQPPPREKEVWRCTRLHTPRENRKKMRYEPAHHR